MIAFCISVFIEWYCHEKYQLYNVSILTADKRMGRNTYTGYIQDIYRIVHHECMVDEKTNTNLDGT